MKVLGQYKLLKQLLLCLSVHCNPRINSGVTSQRTIRKPFQRFFIGIRQPSEGRLRKLRLK